MVYKNRNEIVVCVLFSCKLDNTRICDEHLFSKLAHVQVVINCQVRDATMCTREDGLAFILGAPFIDDVMEL